MRFLIGKHALAGDLTQFYNSCKLTPEQWNLQRFLWLENLDPSGEVLDCVITTLMYGVNSVSAQSEYAMTELAGFVKQEDPELALFLLLSRYVDDLLDSKPTLEACQRLVKAADNLFAKVDLKCKGWTLTGSRPPDNVTKDGLSVGVFGCFAWFPESDVIEHKFARLTFAKPKRGKLPPDAKFFEGSSLEEMDRFIPNPLTKRQCASKVATLWDPLGKLTPIKPIIKLSLRETFQRTDDWDSPMPLDLRQKWVQNFWMIEQLRGLKFNRAVMPLDAVDTKMRVLTGVDAAKEVLLMGSWAGFKLKNGGWSNQHILGRCLLAKNESIPKSELDALCGGSNMAWVIRLALQDWIDSEALFGDSRIALCWVTSEKLRLQLFQRNRVLQIRRGSCFENMYHVKSEYNPADCGNRPAKVKVSDVGPDSTWENGESWMQLDLADAVSQGFITPVSELRITKEIEEDYNGGIVFGESDALLDSFQCINTSSETRKNKIQQRAEFSNYLLLPTKYSFPKTVRIYGYVLRFIRQTRKNKKFVGEFLRSSKLWFSAFTVDLNGYQVNSFKINNPSANILDLNPSFSVADYFSAKQFDVENSFTVGLDAADINLALLYLFRKASNEAKKFVGKQFLGRIAYEVDGILLSKGRLMDGLNFKETSECENLNLGSLGVKVNTPVLDRFSPLSYSIALHVHWELSQHRGIETNNRLALEHVMIIQSMTLFRELAEECIRCHMKRKQYMQVPMGPVAQEQLILAPAFYATMIDLFGPVKSFVPGHVRQTRGRGSLKRKLHIMVAVCITTKVVNLQVLESKSAAGITDGFTCLCAEVGVPSIVHVDQDSGALAAFQSVELDFRDLQHRLWTQYGISFETCPVGGHEQHGLVERIIRSIQELLNDNAVNSKRLHATGWQTFCKLAENCYNNLPFGFSYGRSQDNTELLRILTPNMLRIGRINSRALQGPIRLPVNKKDLMEQVELTYKAWFRIFKESHVPRLMSQPKWFKVDKDLKEKDLVYFRKHENDLEANWSVGQVDQVIRSKDGFIRRAVVKYFNPGDDRPQFTDRAVRKLVKLWSLDDSCIFEDLHEVSHKIANSGPKQADHSNFILGNHMKSDHTVLVSTSFSPQGVSFAGLCYNVLVTGPSLISLDAPVDLAWTMPCEIDSLVVVSDPMVDVGENMDGEDSMEEEDVTLDSLYDILVSTGFYLD